MLRVYVGRLRKPPTTRVWGKLHLAVNPETGEVHAAELAHRRTADCAKVSGLLDQIDERSAFLVADGANNAGAVYGAAQWKGADHRVRVPIPPGRAAPSGGRIPSSPP